MRRTSGAREKNKHASKRLHAGRGPVGKTAVAGVKDRATGRVSASVVARPDGPTRWRCVRRRRAEEAQAFTDDHGAEHGLPHDQTVRRIVAVRAGRRWRRPPAER